MGKYNCLCGDCAIIYSKCAQMLETCFNVVIKFNCTFLMNSEYLDLMDRVRH